MKDFVPSRGYLLKFLNLFFAFGQNKRDFSSDVKMSKNVENSEIRDKKEFL